MSKLVYSYQFADVVLDEEGNEEVVFDFDLPHGREIVEAAVEDWNDSMKISYLHTGFDSKIASMRAYPSKKAPWCMNIVIALAPDARLTGRRQSSLIEALDAQMVDGWGESFCQEVFKDESGCSYRAM